MEHKVLVFFVLGLLITGIPLALYISRPQNKGPQDGGFADKEYVAKLVASYLPQRVRDVCDSYLSFQLAKAMDEGESGKVLKIPMSSQTLASFQMFYLQASDGSIRLIQPTESVLEGVVIFQIEHKYNVTGVIRDVERGFLLRVRPRDAYVEGDRETYTMKIVGRTILDFPNYAVFIDVYESEVDTTVFYRGWHTVEVVYLEDGEQVDSVSADFYFKNGREPSPEQGTVPSKPILAEAISVLLVIMIASLVIYFFFGRRERKRGLRKRNGWSLVLD